MATWLYTVDVSEVWGDEEMPFGDKRDEIVNTLRSSAWYHASEQSHTSRLPELVDELADSLTTREFNGVWYKIYNLADDDRAWIQTC